MQKNISPADLLRFFRKPVCQLCLLWLAGLLLGAFLAANLDGTYFSLMRPSNSGGLSIFRQLAAAYLPFLFAAYAVSIDKPKLMLVLCFFKAFAFSFCGCVICRAYGTAGWLVRFLLQFSDVCTVPILCWFCIRHIGCHAITAKIDLAVCALLATVVACIDSFVVSPFWAELIDYSMGRYTYSCWI